MGTAISPTGSNSYLLSLTSSLRETTIAIAVQVPVMVSGTPFTYDSADPHTARISPIAVMFKHDLCCSESFKQTPFLEVVLEDYVIPNFTLPLYIYYTHPRECYNIVGPMVTAVAVPEDRSLHRFKRRYACKSTFKNSSSMVRQIDGQTCESAAE